MSFSTDDELVEHVLHAHVENLAPIKRKDLPLLLRAEEGCSIDSSGLGGLILHSLICVQFSVVREYRKSAYTAALPDTNHGY